VDLAAYKKSLQGQLEINFVGCHADLKAVTEFPHQEKLVPATCVDCHEQQISSFTQSIHAQKQAKLKGRSLTCADCHDAHNVTSAKEPASPISAFKVQDLCLKCHRSATHVTWGR